MIEIQNFSSPRPTDRPAAVDERRQGCKLFSFLSYTGHPNRNGELSCIFSTWRIRARANVVSMCMNNVLPRWASHVLLDGKDRRAEGSGYFRYHEERAVVRKEGGVWSGFC